MKYKVGDKVKIREDLITGHQYGFYLFSGAMKNLRGKIVTINSVDENGYEVDDFHLPWVTDEMITGKVYEAKAEDYIKTTIDLEVAWNDLVKSYEEKDMRDLDIKQIKVIVPNKVVEVLFTDGLKEKMVCHEDDTFDLRNCLFIAIAKHLYKSEYTLEGIEHKSNELKYMKKYVKIVDSALKKYNKGKEAALKAKKEKENAEALAARKKAKLAKYKAKRKEKYRQERIAEMKEAYVAALKECGMDYDCGCECECNYGVCEPDCDDLK